MHAAIAAPYAQALLQVALQQGLLEALHKDLTALKPHLKPETPLATLVQTPLLPTARKEDLLQKLLKPHCHPLTLRFFLLALRKGRAAYLTEMVDHFIALYKQEKQIRTVHLLLSDTLSPKLQTTIEAAIKKLVQAHQLNLKTTLDPTLIGGYILRFNGYRLDTSLRSQLKRLQDRWLNTL